MSKKDGRTMTSYKVDGIKVYFDPDIEKDFKEVINDIKDEIWSHKNTYNQLPNKIYVYHPIYFILRDDIVYNKNILAMTV